MSRILRRPMFRGGRVDSRGTGIASGLSYEKGGRVGYEPGGSVMSRGGLGGPRKPSTPTGGSIMSRIRNIPYLGKMIPAAGGTIARYSPYGLAALGGELLGNTANLFARGTSTPEGYSRLKEMGSIPFMFDETNIDVGDAFKYIDEGNQIGEKYGIFPRGGPEQRLKDLGLEGQYDPKTGEKIEQIIEEQIKNDTKKDNYNNQFGKKEGEESTEISKADIEKNKELFAELLGGGKARGEDISNMLLSFAGKALKDDATVKSSFSDFFEEESKRPSSKTKVDQAAAQLAINDYIAGKRSKEATENLLAKLKVQADLGEADLYENIVKIAGPGSNPTVANLESALKVTKETRGKPVTRIKSTDTIEIEEKDYDSFLIFEDTKRIMYIDQNGNQIPIY
jgi:hypothetical protein